MREIESAVLDRMVGVVLGVAEGVPDLSDQDLMEMWEKMHTTEEVPFKQHRAMHDAQIECVLAVDAEVLARFGGVS